MFIQSLTSAMYEDWVEVSLDQAHANKPDFHGAFMQRGFMVMFYEQRTEMCACAGIRCLLVPRLVMTELFELGSSTGQGGTTVSDPF